MVIITRRELGEVLNLVSVGELRLGALCEATLAKLGGLWVKGEFLFGLGGERVIGLLLVGERDRFAEGGVGG